MLRTACLAQAKKAIFFGSCEVENGPTDSAWEGQKDQADASASFVVHDGQDAVRYSFTS